MIYAPLYATVDEATPAGGWPASWPDGEAAAAVEAASLLVRDATGGARYAADPTTGLPVHPYLLETMRRATVLQVRGWASAGIIPSLAGVPAPAASGAVASMSGGGRSITYATETTAQADARAAAATTLSRPVLSLLAAAGLTSSAVSGVAW